MTSYFGPADNMNGCTIYKDREPRNNGVVFFFVGMGRNHW